jgi:hypothetical protein
MSRVSRLFAVLAVLVIVGCSSGPDMDDVEKQVVASMFKDDFERAVFEVKDFKKVDGFVEADGIRGIEVSFDIVFKVGVNEMFDEAERMRRRGDMNSWGLAKAATVLQASHGMAKKGDRIPVVQTFRFRETENGWRLITQGT